MSDATIFDQSELRGFNARDQIGIPAVDILVNCFKVLQCRMQQEPPGSGKDLGKYGCQPVATSTGITKDQVQT